MSEEKPQAGEASSDPFAEGVDRLRETAKWLMAVFAAIAATLLAESSLSSIGQFSWGAPRLTAALIAGTLALFAVGVVIWHAARVLAPSPVSIQRLAEDEEKNRKPADVNFVQRNPQLLAGYGSVRELRDTYYGLVEERDALIEQDKWDDAKKRDDRIAYLGGVISQLLSAVAADRVHRQFKRTVWVMFVAGFVAAAGIILFVWAANPPAPKQEKPAASGQALLGAPFRSGTS